MATYYSPASLFAAWTVPPPQHLDNNISRQSSSETLVAPLSPASEHHRPSTGYQLHNRHYLDDQAFGKEIGLPEIRPWLLTANTATKQAVFSPAILPTAYPQTPTTPTIPTSQSLNPSPTFAQTRSLHHTKSLPQIHGFVYESYHDHRSRLEREGKLTYLHEPELAATELQGLDPVQITPIVAAPKVSLYTTEYHEKGSWGALLSRDPISSAPLAAAAAEIYYNSPASGHPSPARDQAALSASASTSPQLTAVAAAASSPDLELAKISRSSTASSLAQSIPSITVTDTVSAMEQRPSQDAQAGAREEFDLPVYGPDLPKNWPAMASIQKEMSISQRQIAIGPNLDENLPVYGPDLPKNWDAMVRQLAREQQSAHPENTTTRDAERTSPLLSFQAKPESPLSYIDSSPEGSPQPLNMPYMPPAPTAAPPPLPPKDIARPAQLQRPQSYIQPLQQRSASNLPALAQDQSRSQPVHMARSISNESVPAGPAPPYSYHPSPPSTGYQGSFQGSSTATQGRPASQSSVAIPHSNSLPHIATATPPSYLNNHLHPNHSPRLPSGGLSPSPDSSSQNRSRSKSPSGSARRQSWFSRSKTSPPPPAPAEPQSNALAWFVTPQGRRDHDVTPLLIGHRVMELWDSKGDTSVYIFPPERRMGPSFKIDSEMLQASPLRNFLVKKDPSSVLSPSGGPPQAGSYFQTGPKQEYRLLFPTPLGYGNLNSPQVSHGFNADDFEAIVATRNFFAFLSRRPLLSTRRNPDFFAILLAVSRFIELHKFSNNDGSTFGTAIMQNVNYFVDALGLADVRKSRQKTIESLILGEKLKCWPLYNEAFSHAVGKYEEILKLNSPTMTLISELSQRWLERGSHDLTRRLRSLNDRVRTFDFPSLFAGIPDKSEDAKMIRFDKWKSSFNSIKNWFMAYYKGKYGAWPPKAKSKKNSFGEGGLNRLLMKEVYADLSNLYDMLVDRTQLTPRDVTHTAEARPDDIMGDGHKALRTLLDEFDKSDVPVCPPIPFDVPRRPNIQLSNNNLAGDPSGLNNRKLSPEEAHQALVNGQNYDITPSAFTESFKTFERKEANNKSLPAIIDQRTGHWIFVYVMLQCLPMVVIDAPDLHFSEGVEYFLCQLPVNGPSWTSTNEVKKSWYNVGNGLGLAHLPSHVVEHGVDGIFQRSHCWVAAQKWIEATHMDEDETLRLQMERIGLSPSPRPHERRQGYGGQQGGGGQGLAHPVASRAVPGFTVTRPGGSAGGLHQQQQQSHLQPSFGQYQQFPPRS